MTKNQLSPPLKALESLWNRLLIRTSIFCIASKSQLILRLVIRCPWCCATHGSEIKRCYGWVNFESTRMNKRTILIYTGIFIAGFLFVSTGLAYDNF